MLVLIVEPENGRVNRGASPAPPRVKASPCRPGWPQKAVLVVEGKAEVASPCEPVALMSTATQPTPPH